MKHRDDEIYLDELRQIAAANGGKLLSTEWMGNRVDHRFAFADGREITMRPSHLKNGGWPKDPDAYLSRSQAIRSGHAKTSAQLLDEVRQIAQGNCGRLLSQEWLGRHTPHLFAFADGREFSVTPAHLKELGWPKNADAYFRQSEALAMSGKRHIEALREIADTHGGKLLSTEWTNNRKKYRFAFADGREFEIRADALSRRGWPKNPDEYLRHSEAISAGKARAFEEMLSDIREIADAHGGVLLSPKWLGRDTKHLFAFADGSHFEITPQDLKRNGWPRNAEPYINRTGPAQTGVIDSSARRLAPLRAIAEANGGRLITSEWLGMNTPHRFAFSDDHEFEMQPAYLKANGWPKNQDAYLRRSSSREDILLEALSNIAIANGGKLISTEWMGSGVPHRFAFADGREFQIRPGSLKSHGWPKDPDRYFRFSNRMPKAGGLSGMLGSSKPRDHTAPLSINLTERVKAFKEEKEGKRLRPLL